MTIALIGCGFVGSVFATEYAKRAYAGKLTVPLACVDDDTVSDRNAANQNFTLLDINKAKAFVVAESFRAMNGTAHHYQQRLTDANANAWLDSVTADTERPVSLLVNAVDNLATRQLVWRLGLTFGIPVLHLGLSEQGTGAVEWTTPVQDGYSLKPGNAVGKVISDPVSGVTPPCELVRLRSVGWNTSFAAAKAAAIYFGFDADSVTPTPKESAGWATSWVGNPTGHAPLGELHHLFTPSVQVAA